MRTRGTGGLIKKKNSRFWYGLFWQNGRQRTVSLKTESKMMAERALAKIIASLARREALPQDLAKITYEDLRADLLQDYQLSGRRSLYHDAAGQPWLTQLKHLDSFFAGSRVPVITPDAVNLFKLERQVAGEAPATTNRALSALRRMFHLAVRHGKLQTIPYIGLFKEAPARKGFLEPAAFCKLRAE